MNQNVLVVEDDRFLLIAISQILQSEGFAVMGFANAAEALAWANLNPVAIAVLDLHLGDGPTGLDLAMELRRLDPRIALVFLTSFSDPKLLNTSLPPLPKGSVYLQKSELENPQELLDSIAQAKSLGGTRKSNESPLSQLTGSQIETLKLVAQGLSNSEIAKRRFVTERAVEQTIARAAKALNLSSGEGGNQRVNLAKAFFRETGLKVID